MDKIITDVGILRQVSRETTVKECIDLDIFNRLDHALKNSSVPGIGLAAIQIGVPIRAGIIRIESKPKFNVNILNPNRLKCLTNTHDCTCKVQPVRYTFGERLELREVAEHYIQDVCYSCKKQTTCADTRYLMYFKGISGRRGEWQHYATINARRYPLFRYKVWCKQYERRKE